MALLGSALAGKGDKAQAAAAFAQAIDAKAGDLEYFALLAGDFATAMGRDVAAQAMQERLAKNPKHAAAGYMLALNKKEAGDKAGAIADLQQILQSFPKTEDDSQLINRLAVLKAMAAVYYEMGEYAKSKDQYNDLLDAANKYPKIGRIGELSVFAMNNLAYLLMDKLQDAKAALPYSMQAAVLNPSEPNIHDTLGWNQLLVGQTEQAITTLRQAIKLADTRNAAIQYHLAEALYRKAQAQTDAVTKKATMAEAAAACREAYNVIKTDKKDPEAVLDSIMKLGEKLELNLNAIDLKKPAGQTPS